MTLNTNKTHNWDAIKNITIAILVTILVAATSAGIAFLKGVEYAESKQHQTDIRVTQAVAQLKAEGQPQGK